MILSSRKIRVSFVPSINFHLIILLVVERLSSIDQWVKISEIVTAHLDIMHFPKKGLCRSMAEYCGNPMDKKLLLFLASRKGSDHYMQLARLHASFIDFLYTFSSCMLPLDLLITLCPPLQPRSFSLSRVDCFDTLNIIYSPIKFVVGDENNESLCPIDRIGVCSSYLDRMCLLLQKSTKDLYLDIFLRLPPPPPLRFPRDPTAPIVLICTGTGVSPFMAFLRQEIIRRREFDKNFCNFSHISDEIKRNLETRNFDANSTSNFCSLEATRDDGRLDNPQIVLGVNNNNQILGSRCIWLIYGFRNWDQDFLMKDEILAMHSAGLITRLIPVQSRPTSSSHVDTPMYVKDGDGQPDELHKSQTAEFTLKIPKRYVQHALEENGDEVYNLISSHPQGAICVCGEELGMVREVNSAIARILKRKLELDSEREATLAVAQWTANRKIIRDVWV